MFAPARNEGESPRGAARRAKRQNLRTIRGLAYLAVTNAFAALRLLARRTHVRHFAEMTTHRRGRQLDAWMTAVLADDLPELHSFVTGLRRDQDAVTAGLTLSPVEGHVNRLKTIKRQMYGHAKHDLLRKRVLLGTDGGRHPTLFECVR